MTKTDKVLKKLMAELDIDAPLSELKMGILVEQEHSSLGLKKGLYAVIPNKLVFLVKIAAAHLAEMPDYYTRLREMESKKASTMAEKLKRMYRRQIAPEDREKTSYEQWGKALTQKAEDAIFPDDVVRKPKVEPPQYISQK